MHPYNVWIISNVSLLKVKLIIKKIEIVEEMPIVNGCNASYSCLYSFIVDFHPLKVKLTKERMHPYNVWIISNVSLLKVKLIRKKIEIFEEMPHCKWMWCFLLFLIWFYSRFPPFKSQIDKVEYAPIQCVDYK